MTDYNRDPGDNFEVFQEQQAPSFVVPQTGASDGLIGSPVPGLTNEQTWARFGIAVSGRVAPCSNTRPRIVGFACGIQAPLPAPAPASKPLRGQRVSPRHGNAPSLRSLESSERLPAVMKTRDLVAMGIPAGAPADHAKQILQRAQKAKQSMRTVLDDLKRVAASPSAFVADDTYGTLARQLVEHAAVRSTFRHRHGDAPYRIWGRDFDASAIQQLKNACKLPVSVSAALMPDAHVGYGLPIGGVLATHEAGHSVRRRRGHRVPHEDDGAGSAAVARSRTSSRGSRTPSSARRGSAWARRSGRRGSTT